MAHKRGFRPPKVVIFGGGITGLTAAHELIERGFQVWVVEKRQGRGKGQKKVQLGGLAATQYMMVPGNSSQNGRERRQHKRGTSEERSGGIALLANSSIMTSTQDVGIGSQQQARPSPEQRYDWSRTGPLHWFLRLPESATEEEICEALEKAHVVTDIALELSYRRAAELPPEDLQIEVTGHKQLAGLVRKCLVQLRDKRTRDGREGAGEPFAWFVQNRLRGIVSKTWSDFLEPLMAHSRAARESDTDWAKLVQTTLVDLGAEKNDTWADSRADQIRRTLKRGLSGQGQVKRELERIGIFAALFSDSNAPGWLIARKRLLDELTEDAPEAKSRWESQLRGGYTAALDALANGRGASFVVPHMRDPSAPGPSPAMQRRGAVPPTSTHKIKIFVVDRLVPGEHGFRFFPGFYRNLFDTMARTPIFDEHKDKRKGTHKDTHRSVFDNLVPLTRLGMDDRDHQLISLSRRSPTTFGEVRRAMNIVSAGLHFTTADQTRFALRMGQYITTCSKRREAELEDVSWWEFIEGDEFSPKAREQLLATPHAMVAMSVHSDARMFGALMIQFFVDYFTDGKRTDLVLNDPTTEAWFNPWKRYLKRQDVKFLNAELLHFSEDKRSVQPMVRRAPNAADKSPWGSMGEDDFYILATDVETAKRAVEPLNARQDSAVGTLQRYTLNPNDRPPREQDPMRVLTGIQYYFRRRLNLFDGHLYFTDSPWGLTSISQPQFWRHYGGKRNGGKSAQFRTILSVDIGRFDQLGFNGKTAWDCSADELALEVWDQIIHSLDFGRDIPIFDKYHIDDFVHFNRFDRFSYKVIQDIQVDGHHASLRERVSQRGTDVPTQVPQNTTSVLRGTLKATEERSSDVADVTIRFEPIATECNTGSNEQITAKKVNGIWNVRSDGDSSISSLLWMSRDGGFDKQDVSAKVVQFEDKTDRVVGLFATMEARHPRVVPFWFHPDRDVHLGLTEHAFPAMAAGPKCVGTARYPRVQGTNSESVLFGGGLGVPTWVFRRKKEQWYIDTLAADRLEIEAPPVRGTLEGKWRDWGYHGPATGSGSLTALLFIRLPKEEPDRTRISVYRLHVELQRQQDGKYHWVVPVNRVQFAVITNYRTPRESDLWPGERWSPTNDDYVLAVADKVALAGHFLMKEQKFSDRGDTYTGEGDATEIYVPGTADTEDLTIKTPPARGMLEINWDFLIYRPDEGFCGVDSFEVEVTHQGDKKRVAMRVNVRHTARPSAYDIEAEVTPKDLSRGAAGIPIRLPGSPIIAGGPAGSINPGNARWVITQQPTRGHLTGTPPNLIYHPDINVERERILEVHHRITGGSDDNNFFRSSLLNRVGRVKPMYQVNPIGDFKKRPGVLPKRTDAPPDPHHSPPIHDPQHEHNYYKGLVLAGTYMKTYMRLTSMEAANESGRHAVNVILEELRQRRQGRRFADDCEIWDIEKNVFDRASAFVPVDIEMAQKFDEILFEAGHKHVFEELNLYDNIGKGGLRDLGLLLRSLGKLRLDRGVLQERLRSVGIRDLDELRAVFEKVGGLLKDWTAKSS